MYLAAVRQSGRASSPSADPSRDAERTWLSIGERGGIDREPLDSTSSCAPPTKRATNSRSHDRAPGNVWMTIRFQGHTLGLIAVYVALAALALAVVGGCGGDESWQYNQGPLRSVSGQCASAVSPDWTEARTICASGGTVRCFRGSLADYLARLVLHPMIPSPLSDFDDSCDAARRVLVGAGALQCPPPFVRGAARVCSPA